MQAQKSRWVYQNTLGARFDDIDPGLKTYFGSHAPGTVGVGRGTYRIAGSTRRLLRPVFWLMAKRALLFPESGSDVPFTVVNAYGEDGSIRAVRSFHFPERTRTMQDRMHIEGGRLVDRLGKSGGLELELTAEVVSGGVRLRSSRIAAYAFGYRVPLPRVAWVVVEERAGPSGQDVDVRVGSLIGELFRYAGSFRYSVEPEVGR